MYRWPQGRVIRVVSFALLLLIAGDLAFHAWAHTRAYLRADAAWQPLTYAIIYGVLALVVLIGGAIAVGFKPRTAQFLIEVEQEMTRVTWPKSNEIVRATVLIAIMTVVLAVFIFAVDLVNIWLINDVILDRGDGTS